MGQVSEDPWVGERSSPQGLTVLALGLGLPGSRCGGWTGPACCLRLIIRALLPRRERLDRLALGSHGDCRRWVSVVGEGCGVLRPELRSSLEPLWTRARDGSLSCVPGGGCWWSTQRLGSRFSRAREPKECLACWCGAVSGDPFGSEVGSHSGFQQNATWAATRALDAYLCYQQVQRMPLGLRMPLGRWMPLGLSPGEGPARRLMGAGTRRPVHGPRDFLKLPAGAGLLRETR